MAERRFRAHPRRVAPILIATTIAVIALAASPALANTGTVYFDANNNVGVGETLFNGSFTGSNNVGVGRSVMPSLADGSFNTAIGNGALLQDTTGTSNLATGSNALGDNTSGGGNTATGDSALSHNASGSSNVASGDAALFANTTGDDNVAIGASALSANTGASNLALGFSAGHNLTTGANNVDIANAGKAGEAKTIRIGSLKKQTRAFLAGVSGTTVPGPVQPVVVNSNGQLGTASAAASTKSTVSARKFSRLQRQVRALRHEVSQLRARGR